MKAYSILSDKATSINFTAQPFEAGSTRNDELMIERQNVKHRETLSLSVDYVEFSDGTSWGSDSQKESERIAGRLAGRIAAIEAIKIQIQLQKISDVTDLLKKEITEIIPNVPEPKKSEKWQNGFIQGYRGVLAQLQFAYEKDGVSSISTKLKELEKFLNKEKAQDAQLGRGLEMFF